MPLSRTELADFRRSASQLMELNHLHLHYLLTEIYRSSCGNDTSQYIFYDNSEVKNENKELQSFQTEARLH